MCNLKIPRSDYSLFCLFVERKEPELDNIAYLNRCRLARSNRAKSTQVHCPLSLGYVRSCLMLLVPSPISVVLLHHAVTSSLVHSAAHFQCAACSNFISSTRCSPLPSTSVLPSVTSSLVHGAVHSQCAACSNFISGTRCSPLPMCCLQ